MYVIHICYFFLVFQKFILQTISVHTWIVARPKGIFLKISPTHEFEKNMHFFRQNFSSDILNILSLAVI